MNNKFSVKMALEETIEIILSGITTEKGKKIFNRLTSWRLTMKTIQYAIYWLCFLFLISCGNDDQLDSIEATGTIEAKEITISSKTIGEIKKMRFDEGDKVQQGDTIIVI